MTSTAELAQLESTVKSLIVSKYTTISAATFMLYDIMLQFHLECRLVWTAKFNVLKIAYVVNRYLVCGALCLLSFSILALSQELNHAICRKLPIVLACIGSISFALTNSLLYVRVMILWRRSLSFKIALFSGYLICYAIGLVFFVITIRKLQVTAYYDEAIGSCILPIEPMDFLGLWIPSLFSDVYGLSSVFMSIKSRSVGLGHSRLKFIYYDAIQYFVIVGSLKLALIIVIATRNATLDFLLLGIVWGLLVTIGSRYLMNIYKIGHENEDNDSTVPDSYNLASMKTGRRISRHIQLVSDSDCTSSSSDMNQISLNEERP